MMETYISIDIEASGPYPPTYSMLSFGAVAFVSGDQFHSEGNFYMELKPLPQSTYEEEAMTVNGLNMEKLVLHGADPQKAMSFFNTWLGRFHRPVMVAYPIKFDGLFIHWYFERFLGKDPFGVSGIDIRSYWMGKKGIEYKGVNKSTITGYLGVDIPSHTHNALDDALEQALLFHAMLKS